MIPSAVACPYSATTCGSSEKARDPIPAFAARLRESGAATADDLAALEREVEAEVAAAVAFAVMTVRRPEISIEGSDDGETWREYTFRYKVSDPNRPPRQVAPHQPRLDWQMWFAALSSPPVWVLALLLPLAMPGILTGTILGLARALGESAPLLLIGMVAFVKDFPAAPPQGLMQPATALPAPRPSTAGSQAQGMPCSLR